MQAGPDDKGGLPSRATAYRACMGLVEPLAPSPDDTKPVPLPEGFILRPGNFRLGQRVYSLERGGAYRLLDGLGRWQQRVVFDGNLLHLLSGLAWCTAHGEADNGLSVEEVARTALLRKPVLTCGYVANFGAYCLAGCGVKAHIVTALALEDSPLFGRSHNMLEFYAPTERQWLLCDLSFNCMFTAKGRLLSLFEFFTRAGGGDYETVPLTAPETVPALTGSDSGQQDASLAYEFIAHAANLRAYYRHLCRVPLVYDYTDRLYRFCDPEKIDLVQAVSEKYRYLERDDFLRRYYAAA